MSAVLQILNEETGLWENIPALIGPPGPKGPAPIVGQDYFTESDKQNIANQVLQSVLGEIYYKPGDIVPVHFHTGGQLTGEGKKVYFTIPLSKALRSDVKTVSFEEVSLQVRQNGQYVAGSATEWALPDGSVPSGSIPYSVICALNAGGNYPNYPLSVAIEFNSAPANGINNAPAGVSFEAKLKFA